jgi:hypothetical protein
MRYSLTGHQAPALHLPERGSQELHPVIVPGSFWPGATWYKTRYWWLHGGYMKQKSDRHKKSQLLFK